MEFKVWDSVSYGHLEPLTPFTVLLETDNFNEVTKFVNEYEGGTLFITKNGEMMFNTDEKIYESDGENIFERRIMSNKRKKIN